MSRTKAIAFRALALSLPVLALAGAEGIARLCVAPKDPFVEYSSRVSVFGKIQRNGETYFKLTHPDSFISGGTEFPVNKPPNTVRVMLFGESAASGWPHPPGESFGAYLRQALQDAYPNQRIEFLNLSVNAYASFRIRMVFDDVIDLKPDLIITWIGNNELLERRTYDASLRTHPLLRSLASSSRLVQVLAGSKGSTIPVTAARRDQNDEIWSKVRREALALREDPRQYDAVHEHYRYTLHYMMREAQRRSVPVLALTVPTNLRDWRPNASCQSLSGDALARWNPLFASGLASLEQGKPVAAVETLREATRANPMSADAAFALGQALQAAGDDAAALAAYRSAKDLDCNPFRASSRINDIIRALPESFSNVTVADTEAAVATAAEHGIPGFDMLLDYVHPTKAGNVVIAKAAFEAIAQRKLLGTPSALFHFDQRRYGGPAYDEHADTNLQRMLLYLFVMMHQDEAIAARAEDFARASGEAGIFQFAATTVVPVFRDQVELERRDRAGQPTDPAERERIASAYRDFYARYLEALKGAGFIATTSATRFNAAGGSEPPRWSSQ